MSSYKLKIIFSFILCFGLFSFISLNRHSQGKIFTYHSELWADKAGYNVYLPLVFIYDLDAQKFPENIIEKTGYGFQTDSAAQKIITKYPYGVALLESPFWLIAHLSSQTKDGFSLYYQKSIDFAGCFYLTLGLFFLIFTISSYKKLSLSVLFSIIIITASGIFYYGIFETGMSHIYSFCCLSLVCFLFLKQNTMSLFKNALLLIIASSLFIIIRPINILFFIPIILFFLHHSSTINISRLKQLNHIQIASLIIVFFILIIPQFIYYKYAFGSYFINSYQKEPFLLPSFSRIFELLFSPNNGLLIYYPVLIVLLMVYFFQKNIYNKLNFFLFGLYILIYASWWSLSLGCGFGHRSINDIIILFFLPVFCFSKKIPKTFITIFIVLCLLNVKFIFSYDTCLHKSLHWSYSEYISILFGEFK